MARITDPNAPGYWNQPEFEGDIPRFLSGIPFLNMLAEPFRNRPATESRLESPAGSGPFDVGDYTTYTGGVTLGPEYMPHPDDSERYWQSPQGIARRELEMYRGELDEPTFQRLSLAILRGMPIEDFSRTLDEEVRTSRSNKLWQQQQEEIENLRNNLGPVLDERIGQVQGDADRYAHILENPAAIKGDVEYGQALANAEGLINSQLVQEQRNLSQSNVNRGLARSGKADEMSGRLGLGAAEQRAGLLSGALTDVYGRRESTRDRLLGLKLAKEDLASGNIERARQSAAFLNSLPTRGSYPYATLVDQRLGNLGRQDINDSKTFGYVGLGVNAALTGMSQMGDMISGFMPTGKGG